MFGILLNKFRKHTNTNIEITEPYVIELIKQAFNDPQVFIDAATLAHYYYPFDDISCRRDENFIFGNAWEEYIADLINGIRYEDDNLSDVSIGGINISVKIASSFTQELQKTNSGVYRKAKEPFYYDGRQFRKPNKKIFMNNLFAGVQELTHMELVYNANRDNNLYLITNVTSLCNNSKDVVYPYKLVQIKLGDKNLENSFFYEPGHISYRVNEHNPECIWETSRMVQMSDMNIVSHEDKMAYKKEERSRRLKHILGR
jgi:hypothetical protein